MPSLTKEGSICEVQGRRDKGFKRAGRFRFFAILLLFLPFVYLQAQSYPELEKQLFNLQFETASTQIEQLKEPAFQAFYRVDIERAVCTTALSSLRKS